MWEVVYVVGVLYIVLVVQWVYVGVGYVDIVVYYCKVCNGYDGG